VIRPFRGRWFVVTSFYHDGQITMDFYVSNFILQSTLFILNDDYSIMVYMPLSVAPDAIVRDLED
jgi:hypothetical protein